jgi:hypothetical protein
LANRESILIIIRSEGDFERAISIGREARNKLDISFIFVGDTSPFFKDGIQNRFQKQLFIENGFQIHDFSDFDLIGRGLKKLSGGKKSTIKDSSKSVKSFFQFIFFRCFLRYMSKREDIIINNIYSRIMPSFLFTDQSMTVSTYLPEKIRQKALASNIPVYIFTHGAAGGLHSEFSEPIFQEYPNCIVLACSENETNPHLKNRIILGDMSSSFPYVHYLNEQNFDEIEFRNDKKHRVAFFIGGVMQAFTSTNSWSVQEEIIISLSERKDVAMILKLHPREAQFMDLRMLNKFENLKIVSSETDRSRVTKWSNTVICNDHTSVVFEPMILGKKVAVIEGKHIPKYSNNHSPLIKSSVNFISNFSQFDLESLSNSTPLDDVTNQIAWGGNGPVDLTKLFFSDYFGKSINKKNNG